MEEEKTKFGIVAAVMVMAATLLLASCGNDEQSAKESGHTFSEEQKERAIAEITEDLQIVSALTQDTLDDLSRAMTGSALENTKKTFEDDLTQGRYRQREYRNINVAFNSYSSPIIQVLIEFDDFGFYVDTKTGAALGQPTGEQRRYAAYAVEEDGRWKIKGLFEPSNPDTPQELPE